MPLSPYFKFEHFSLQKVEREYRAANPQEFPSNPDREDDYTLGLITQMLDVEPTIQESRQQRIVPRYPENSSTSNPSPSNLRSSRSQASKAETVGVKPSTSRGKLVDSFLICHLSVATFPVLSLVEISNSQLS